MADTRPQYQSGIATIGNIPFHWGSGSPGQYWSIPYGDYPVTPNAPTGAWAHQVGAIPISNNVIPDPVLHRNRIGIMIHPGSSQALDQLYTQGCFAVAPQEWPAVKQEILKESSNGPLYLHISPNGASFSSSATPPSNAMAYNQSATPSSPAVAAINAAASPGTTINSNAIDTLGKNIASIETGGQSNPYTALGPQTSRGQAIGKYQVMPFNVGPWTQQALGHTLTSDQFRNDPAAQEAVFRDQMTRGLAQYSPQDVASMWFTGKPYAQAGSGATDKYTTNANYVARATAGLPNATTAPSTTVASAAPPQPSYNPLSGGSANTGLPAAAQPQPGGFSIGGAIAKLTTPTEPGGLSPIQKLEKVFDPKKQDGGGGQQGGAQGADAALQLQQAAAAQGNMRQQQIALQAQQMAAAMRQKSMEPLTWGSQPYGSDAGLQMGIPGTTLNSIGA